MVTTRENLVAQLGEFGNNPIHNGLLKARIAEGFDTSPAHTLANSGNPERIAGFFQGLGPAAIPLTNNFNIQAQNGFADVATLTRTFTPKTGIMG